MSNTQKHSAFTDYLFALPQYLLPHHAISRLVLWVTRCRTRWLKNGLMRWFIRRFNVNMAEAAQGDYRQFESFNAFFTRELKPDARPLAPGDNLALCPVDGAVSQVGNIREDSIFQAKGHDYSATALLGGDRELARQFANGQFATLYLSPRDYHRIHMPVAGSLKQMIYVPGRLFSVNPKTVRCIPGLFARNERVVALFDTELGPMALVLVGAINVACIETVWHGVVTPPHRASVQRWHYSEQTPVHLDKGEEMGRFNMGSTVVCLFANDKLAFDTAVTAGAAIQMGQALATV
ncbi:MAG: phosphatidylserine decarboxylase [Gammaproteobacteria bacterium]|nr:phosphatidylserine decarboxylase [Gammaproteobacteria bacterium]